MVCRHWQKQRPDGEKLVVLMPETIGKTSTGLGFIGFRGLGFRVWGSSFPVSNLLRLAAQPSP